MTTDQYDVPIEHEESQEEPRRLDAFFWAGALIWIGLVFWADSQGWLPQFSESSSAWTWIFLGGGIAGLGLNLFSYTSPKYANPTVGDYFWSGLLLLIGLGGLTTFTIPWPLVLVVVGVVFLVNTLIRHRQ
jgi:hypothetical protein